MSNFDKLVKMFIATDDLGHYNSENYIICLYGQKDTPSNMKRIKQMLESITKKYKLQIDKINNSVCSIYILDIDL